MPTSNLSAATLQLDLAIQDAISVNVLAQADVNTLMSTPLINLSPLTSPPNPASLPFTYPSHQAGLDQWCSSYIGDHLSPSGRIYGMLADVIGFANRWNSYEPGLERLICNLGDPVSLDELKKGLENLENGIEQKMTHCDGISLALTTYAKNLDLFARPVLTSANALKEHLIGQNGELTDLLAKVDALKTDMRKDNETNARGATKQALGIVIIVGVILKTIFSSVGEEGGGSPDLSEDDQKLIASQIDIISQDIHEQTEATKDWKDKFETYKKTIFELTDEQQLLTISENIAGSARSISADLTELVSIVKTVKTAWNGVSGELSSIAAAADNNDPDTALRILEGLQNSWSTLRSLALSLQINTAIVSSN